MATINKIKVGNTTYNLGEGGGGGGSALLEEFFGVYEDDGKVMVQVPDGEDYQVIPADLMTEQEVYDILEDIMQGIDYDLTSV